MFEMCVYLINMCIFENKGNFFFFLFSFLYSSASELTHFLFN